MTASNDNKLQVACLCAAWCRVCDGFRAEFDALAARFESTVVWRWVDVEDEESELLGLEVETFPCLLVASAGQLRFFGPVAPQGAAVERLVQAAGEAVLSQDALAQQVAQRLFNGA
ncbi:thioredoxin domain-containing protein [Roseateles sp. BYS180W]|uniref:Thioredoxin domain-containing protein n=1 Tax=Roseateles rivi TaxID=3299028 RepID=A0ABW7FUL1_9BURK